MQEPIVKKHSRLAVAAILISATIWIYLALIFLSRDFWGYLLTMGECNVNDFGACALKKLFGPFIALFTALVLAIIPLLIYGISTTMSVIVCRRQTHKKDFAFAALINNGLSFLTAGFVAFISAILK